MFYYHNQELDQIFKTAKKFVLKNKSGRNLLPKVLSEIKDPTEEQKQNAIDFDEYCTSLYERGIIPSPEQVNKWRWEYEQSNVKK